MAYQTTSSDRAGAGTERTDAVRALGQKLARTERLSPAELDAYRAPLLSKLLAHARLHTEFYKRRIDFDISSPDNLGKLWSTIPIFTRAEAVANQDALMSARTPNEVGAVKDGRTSGSTGMPLRYRTTDAHEIANVALTERMFRWWRVDGKKTFAQISQPPSQEPPSPRGLTSKGWHSARPNGGFKHFLSHSFDVDAQLEWLLARKPAYLASFSGIVRELAATAKRRGVPLKLELIFSGAAPVDAETRDLCRSVFGAEIADTYGAQETGHIAAQCPDCGEYHASADTSVVEILRDDGAPAAPGETGRVVVTPLYGYAMPLIRYELGDFAEVGTADPKCDRKLPTLRRIMGRYRNLFRFRDGTRIWPVATLFRLNDFVMLKQFQIVQTDFDHIEVKYVPDGVPGAVDLAALTQRVRTVLNQPVDVTLRAVDRIERTATGKYEDCVSLVSPD
jgi:phenylacetate-CoA ligase